MPEIFLDVFWLDSSLRSFMSRLFSSFPFTAWCTCTKINLIQPRILIFQVLSSEMKWKVHEESHLFTQHFPCKKMRPFALHSTPYLKKRAVRPKKNSFLNGSLRNISLISSFFLGIVKVKALVKALKQPF